MNDRWMNLEQVASYLGVTAYDVLSWIDTREMPVREVANAWRFDPSEVDTWADRTIGRGVAKRCQS